MGKKIKVGRKAERKARRAAVAAAEKHTKTPIPARDSVLATPELLDLILTYLPVPFCLSSAQRVCRTWHAIIARFSRTYLGSLRSSSAPRVMNPVLMQHFAPIFAFSPAVYMMTCYSAGPGLLAMTIAQTNGTRAVHEAFARRGASWRRMQLCAPPLRQLRFRDGQHREQVVAMPDGVRMGALYDLVVAVALKSHPWGRYSVRVDWLEGDAVIVTQDYSTYGRPYCYDLHRPTHREHCHGWEGGASYSSSKWLLLCDEAADGLVVKLTDEVARRANAVRRRVA